jgi:hypothetical protein
MRQQKFLTNFDKGKRLFAARQRLGLDAAGMAELLHVDALYYLQLENGCRGVDEYFLTRALVLAHLPNKNTNN